MYHRCSTAHYTQVNQHKKKTVKKQLRIGRAVIKRIQRLLNDQSSGDTSKEQCNQVTLEFSFREGLCRVLSGLNAATTRNVISTTMVHLIPSNGGSCFVFLHDFSDLLVDHMEATLEGQNINLCIRTNKLQDGQLISWADSLADDYIHCPLGENFEMCLLWNDATIQEGIQNFTKRRWR